MFDDLPEQQAPVSLKDQIKCVIRELGMRREVYPRRVTIGKMTGAFAAKEICRMEAVLATLQDHAGAKASEIPEP